MGTIGQDCNGPEKIRVRHGGSDSPLQASSTPPGALLGKLVRPIPDPVSRRTRLGARLRALVSEGAGELETWDPYSSGQP